MTSITVANHGPRPPHFYDGCFIEIYGPQPPSWWNPLRRLWWCLRNRRWTRKVERHRVVSATGTTITLKSPIERGHAVRMGFHVREPEHAVEIYGIRKVPPAWLPHGPRLVNRPGFPTRWS